MGDTLMNKLATGIISLGILAAAATGALAENVKLDFNLSWLPQGSTAGIVVAADKGYYGEEGLDVTPVRGFGGLRTINEIDQGLFDFGYGSPDGVIVNRAKGGKTRLVGSINATNPGGICYVNERRQVKSLADMKGLKLGGAAGTPVNVTFPALLVQNGLPADHVEIIQLQGAVIYSALLDGSIDIYECWLASGKPLLEHQAKAAGVTIGFLPYEEIGLKTLGSGIATTDAVIEQKPELVEKVLRGSYKGYAFMLENPEESADIVKKHFPEVDRDAVLAQILDINALIKGPGFEEHGMGWIDPGRADAMVKFISSANNLGDAVKTEDLYTNRFITK